ncbi:MAG: DEAD/DEAH box helicase family protein, partial [Planctomycetes bacterium]|nr:DEAD/DEAH box helicase family protein [Planctomycetota bacterium]
MENAEEGGILELACGKGKTIISLETIARLGLWAMVVVNTTSLLKQWADAAYEFLGYEAGIIQQDVVQWRPLTIAMIHTLATGRFHTAEELKHYGAVFFDEAHHLAAPTFNQVCPLFYG